MPRRSHQTESSGESEQGIAGGKGHTVVGANGVRQAEVLEGSLENGKGEVGSRGRHTLAGDAGSGNGSR